MVFVHFAYVVYGDIYDQDVAKYLIRHESHSLSDIVRHFSRQSGKSKDISSSQIRHSLLVLLQHNCLKVEQESSEEEGEGSEPTYFYKVDLDMVVNRLRFPKFLATIDKLFGNLAVRLVEELIFHGRLRFDQIVEDVQAQQKDARTAKIQEVCTENDIDYTSVTENTEFPPEIELQLPPLNSKSDIQTTFEKLAENRFLVPAPSRIPPVAEAELSDEETNCVKDTTSQRTTDDNGKITVKRSRQNDTFSMNSLPVEVGAFLAQSSSETSTTRNDDYLPPPKIAKVRGGRGKGGRDGRKGEVSVTTTVKEVSSSKFVIIRLECDNYFSFLFQNDSSLVSKPHDFENGSIQKDVLWMVGWVQLAEEERNALCVTVTSQRIGSIGASVVEYLLSSRGPGSISETSLSSVADIHCALRDNEKGFDGTVKSEDPVESIDLKTLSVLLETMRCDSTSIVAKVMCDDKCSTGRVPCYMVNKAAVLTAVRRSLIHAIAEERFGYQSARIVELLQRKTYLEQQKISDMAILPAKEGRERLYELYRNHWVDYVEVSKRGDFNPSSTYFFWTLSVDKLIENLLNAQYGAVYNLRCRYLKEVADGKTLLDFSHKITDAEEAQKFDKLSESLDRLDNAVLKIIENITVLGIL